MPGPVAPAAADDRPQHVRARPRGVAKGAYVLADAATATPEVILIGTGSEVQLCVEAYESLTPRA